MFVNSEKFNSSFIFIRQNHLLCGLNDVTLIDVELHGKAVRTCKTKKRAIAKALQREGHPDFAPVDLAYYQHFLGFLFENIAFWEVPPGNHKCRSRGATPLVNVK